MQIAQAQRPQQGLRLLDPSGAIPVHHHYPLAFDGDLADERERRKVMVVVTSHRRHRSDALESRNRLRASDIARVQDQVDAAKSFEDAIRKAIEELRTVGVRDDSDARRQLLDPGRLQAGRVRAFGIGAGVECMEGGRGEDMGARLVQVQVDVGERKPGAVRLATRVDGLRGSRHGGGRYLSRNRHVLAARQCRECGLRRGVTCIYRRAASFRPGEPFRVRAVLWRWHDSFLDEIVRLLLLLLNHLP